MALDLKEIDYVLEKVHSELGTLLHIEKHRTPIGGFVVATESLSAIKEVPDNQLWRRFQTLAIGAQSLLPRLPRRPAAISSVFPRTLDKRGSAGGA